MKDFLLFLYHIRLVLKVWYDWKLFFRKLNKEKYAKVNSKVLKKWQHKWSVFKVPFSNNSYRLFSNYIKEDINICPMEIIDSIIEPVLNPLQYGYLYSDKNMFDRLFPSSWMPVTIVRNLHGSFYDRDYQRILKFNDDVLKDLLSLYSKIIVKPTLLSSGIGVRLFTKKGDSWINNSGEKLTFSFLAEKYESDFIIQECLSQHSFMDSLNPSSVNTIRVACYRSVLTDEIIILNAIVRIGKHGKCVDNAHAGGVFCGVTKSGVLGNYVCDYLGNISKIFNGINFSTMDLRIPYYERILEFSRKIASKVVDQRLLALDIMLDDEGYPKMIEINVGGFSAWLFQFTNGSAFGAYTDEIIEYCLDNMNESKMIVIK